MDRKWFIDKIDGCTGKEKIDAILEYSRYLTQNDPQESVLQARHALQLAREIKDEKTILSTYVHLAYANLNGGNNQKALQWADHLLESGIHLEIKPAIGLAYNLKGSIAHAQNCFPEAVENFLKAIKIYLELENKAELMSCYNNLGSVHTQMSDLDEAMDYFKLALPIAEELNRPAKITLRMNLANLLFKQERYQEALEIYQYTAEYYHENDITAKEASAIFNIALTYSAMDDVEKALEYLLQSYNTFKNLNLISLLVEVCVTLGKLLTIKKEYSEAMKYLSEGKVLAEKDGLIKDLTDIHAAFATLYEQKGELAKCNKNLKKQNELLKNYYQDLHKSKMEEMEAQHKTQIYMLKSNELDAQNKVMCNQLDDLNDSLKKLKKVHLELKQNFSEAVERINSQDNLLSSQSRMAVMGEMLSSIAHQWKQPLNVIGVLSQSI
jgi:tetratricopeptide (TPR) repeat protein